MTNYKKIFFLLVLFGINAVYSQNKIDFDEIKGSLSQTDKFKKDFGIYKGFEFPLYEGETINFALFSNEMKPKIILVDPKGSVYKQSSETKNNFTSLITSIPTSGDWIVYIVANQKENGNFLLRYAVAQPNMLNYNSNMDFCSTLNLLITHASARFMMLNVSGNDIKLPNSLNSFISNDGSFENILFNSNSMDELKTTFDQYRNLILQCLPDWKMVNNENSNSATWSETNSSNPIIISLDIINNDLKVKIR